MLTSLAVTLAFSLGATTLPVEVAAPTWAPPVGDSLASAADDWSDPPLPTRWLRATPTVGSAHAVIPTARAGHTVAAGARSGDAVSPTSGVDRAVVGATGSTRTVIGASGSRREVSPSTGSDLVGVAVAPAPVVLATVAASVVPAGRQRVAIGWAPAALGSRAPPTR
ncbi:hypothetical protein ACFO0M_02150 [Micromonospora mangrovi]|uniref:Secreted protein n=2 Tax=Micromonospora TaxID=1873 RepID=A0AAU8HKR8_9ACTN